MRAIAKIFVLVTVLALIAPCSLFAQSDMTRIVHIPVSFAKVNSDVQIEATIESSSGIIGNITASKLWFKGSNEDVFNFVDMIPFMDKYVGTIPSEFVTFDGVDYFIEFVLSDGSAQTYPTSQPLSEPFTISVRPVDADAAKNPILLLSPTPFGRSYGETLIAIGFNRSVLLVEPGKVKIQLNGQDFTSRANISEDVAVLVVNNLTAERQRIDLIYDGDDGPEILGSWTFFWKSADAKGFVFSEYGSAKFSSEVVSQRYSGNEQNLFRERFNAKFDYGLIHLSTFGVLTSEEQATLQPQHRFQTKLGFGKALTFRWGDINPRYNELVLWGRRVRGSEFVLDAKYVKLNAIYGDLNRSKDPDITVGYTPPTDTTEAVYDYTLNAAGTYKRHLGAAKLTFGNPRKALFGLTVMKVKDDTSSVLYGGVEDANIGSRPKDNLVAGFDVNFYFDRRRISLKAETALSLYNTNTLGAPLEDAEDFKDIIWINQYFDPLPSEGLGDDSTDFETSEVIKSIMNNALSYKAKMRIRYLGNDIKAGVKKINRSFYTLGNPTLTNDKQGYFVNDRIRMFKSNLYLNGGYEYYYDNVTGKGDIRNDQTLITAGFSLYTPEYMPDLNFTFRNSLATNDGELTYFWPDSLTNPTDFDSIDTRRENESGSWNMALTHKLNIKNTTNNITLSFLNSDRSDTYNELGASDNQMVTFFVRTRYEQPMMSTVRYSTSEMNSMGGFTTIGYDNFEIIGSYFLFNKKLIPYFGPLFTFRSGQFGNTATEPDNPEDHKTTVRYQHVDNSSVNWKAGFTWNVVKNHSLDGMVSMVSYSENSEYEYWNGERFSIQELSIDNDGAIIDQPVYLKRNDFLMSIRYQVRF